MKKNDIPTPDSNFEISTKVLHDESAFAESWEVWSYKGHNPFGLLDFIVGEHNQTFRVSIQGYTDPSVIYVTKAYSSRQQALREVGRILDRHLTKISY